MEDERDVHTLEKNHFKEEAERMSSKIQTLEERLEEKINEVVRLVNENESLRQQLHTERENRRIERNEDAAEFERRRRRLVNIVKQNTELVINRMIESANTVSLSDNKKTVFFSVFFLMQYLTLSIHVSTSINLSETDVL